jgi:nicotinamidase-related amidase
MAHAAIRGGSRTRKTRVLLLLDFQDDFMNRNGRMPVADQQAKPVLSAARQAMINAAQAGDLVVAIGNEFKRNSYIPNFFRNFASIQGSPGSRWTSELPLGETPYFPKWRKSAFSNPEFHSWINEHHVGTVALAGLQAKACVTATAKDALARGLRVELISGAIACVSDKSRDRALAHLARRGAMRI